MKIAGWLFCACTLSAQTVTVTGSVTNAITHEPIEGVSVVLFPITGSTGANSDASGRFRIPNVKAGGYRLSPSKGGFEGSATEIQLEPGADPQPFKLSMVPWPTVRGRVLDPDRQPVARVRVRAMNPGNAPGTVYEVTTDAAGRFALERLVPGRYHFLALPAAAGNATGATELAPTWFPDAIAERDVPSVSLAPGDDFSGYDIILRTVPVFRVSGRILDDRGEPLAGATVQTSLAERKATSREDGTFELERVRAGEGAVRAEWRRGDEQLLRGFAKVVVSRHDIEGLAVRVSAPVAVSGTIELDGQAGHRCEGEAVLAPVDGEGERVRGEFSESGIRFEHVYPGRYRLTVLPGWKPGRYYLDAVRMGELDLTLNELEVVPGMLPFRVLLRTGGGGVRGTVENGNGGLVVLTPQDERLRFRPFIVVALFQGGMFALENVRPGNYYAFALQGSFNSDEMQNPEYAGAYLGAAKTVRLERGGTATLTLDYVKH